MWSEKRKEEAAKLYELLPRIAGANNGSFFLERIGECIENARPLSVHCIDTGERSFAGFLIGLSHGEERKAIAEEAVNFQKRVSDTSMTVEKLAAYNLALRDFADYLNGEAE